LQVLSIKLIINDPNLPPLAPVTPSKADGDVARAS
jgi:hypothetical protein